jgi:hypothetical protein
LNGEISMAFNGNTFKVLTVPMWQWSFGDGECENCDAFVPQLVRCTRNSEGPHER